MIQKGDLILAEGKYYDMDCYRTKLNNNVLVVGTSGSGKTRSIVSPNIMQATGSYIISDPKGNLYGKYKAYLEAQGYEVKKLDFSDPKHSIHYNFFSYIRDETDVMKLASILIDDIKGVQNDAFWTDSSRLLLQAVIGYIMECMDEDGQNLKELLEIIARFEIDENRSGNETLGDLLFHQLEMENPDSYAVRQYKKFRIATGKTLKSILITVQSQMGLFDTGDLREMLSFDETNIQDIGRKKTALFVVVSDMDRSFDKMANIFFTQAMAELCRVADHECEDQRLPIPVRFILDDFATNCKIEQFPRMISSIRSRGISTMLMIQSESQLRTSYATDDKTIISNCDTYVYLGGNDVETAQAVAYRCDLPLRKILEMPVGNCWIFRRGEKAYNGKIFDLDRYQELTQTQEEREKGDEQISFS